MKEKENVIIVNGREKEVTSHKLSYHDLIILAFGVREQNPNAVYTVTYSKGKKEDKGSLVEGEDVTVKKGMVVNVTRTDKS